MWFVQTASVAHKTPAGSDLPTAAAGKPATSIAVLRAAVRRQPQLAAGVIAFWLRK
ncbi:MAG TPA: hypothetical protein VMJ32_08125 [Pirellulales bacterium]|nr:hypothetical protein [Pirellulales bacterium]